MIQTPLPLKFKLHPWPLPGMEDKAAAASDSSASDMSASDMSASAAASEAPIVNTGEVALDMTQAFKVF